MKNNTFDKAKKNSKKWYIINGKKYTYYVWALPLVPFVTLYDTISQQADRRRTWSTERATKVLDYVLPQIVEWVEKDKAYYYCMYWGTGNLWINAKRKDRKWARKWRYQLQNFIKEEYENEHYFKSVEKDYHDTEIWIKFKEKK